MPDGRLEHLMAADMRTLCRVADIPENGAKGFPGADGAFTGLIVVRQGDLVYVYENACPHIGTPLDWTPDRFLTADGRHLICATHGAVFTIDTGRCISGPCRGDQLTSIDAVIRDGVIQVPRGG
jgi:nitrite reductase/ring-hydroxylating ferredoxin subunit